jgi:predicted nuclease of restriction endonuclease-like (RecB) superfamily
MEESNSIISLSQAVEAIKTAILQGQYEAAKDVNRVQLAVYFSIGRYLSKNTRRLPYGTGALKAISEQLRKELPGLRGYSENNLKNMRKFYEAWNMLDYDKCNLNVTNALPPNEQSTIMIVERAKEPTIAIVNSQNTDNYIDIYHAMQVPDVAEFPVEDFFRVPFTHHVRMVEKAKNLQQRYYYIHRTAEEHLSVEALEKLIKQNAYENREKLPNNFVKTISNSSEARKAVMMFKDSYLLNFINVEEIGERDKQDVDERVVEQKIVHNIKNFIMTFGRDFSFIGNQYHLEVYGVEFFPDLLFFNRELNALVVIELKTDEFKPSYLGQLTTYLRILDDHVKKPHENPSIGIVLCKSANKEFVEYVIQDYQKPMGVATYKTADDMPENLRKALPDIDALKSILAGDKDFNQMNQ